MQAKCPPAGQKCSCVCLPFCATLPYRKAAESTWSLPGDRKPTKRKGACPVQFVACTRHESLEPCISVYFVMRGTYIQICLHSKGTCNAVVICTPHMPQLPPNPIWCTIVSMYNLGWRMLQGRRPISYACQAGAVKTVQWLLVIMSTAVPLTGLRYLRLSVHDVSLC